MALDDLTVSEVFRDQRLDSVSGRWQWTARAAVPEPDILLLNEPTDYLDLSRIRACSVGLRPCRAMWL